MEERECGSVFFQAEPGGRLVLHTIHRYHHPELGDVSDCGIRQYEPHIEGNAHGLSFAELRRIGRGRIEWTEGEPATLDGKPIQPEEM
jgi:hypothetical protein